MQKRVTTVEIILEETDWTPFSSEMVVVGGLASTNAICNARLTRWAGRGIHMLRHGNWLMVRS